MWSLCAAALTLGSCIDNDYDLSEDIDLTVNVGGQLITIPSSSTDLITLYDILELDDESSIKAVEHQGDYGLDIGDYVLLQEGESKPANFKIDEVAIRNHPNSTGAIEVPQFINAGFDRITQHAGPVLNYVNLSDNNVDRQLVELLRAEMAVDIHFEVRYDSPSGYDGDAIIDEGFEAVFPETWTVEVLSPSYLTVTDGHKVRFGRDAHISPNAPFVAEIRIVNMDFENLPAGQGLYEPGHFNLNAEIRSEGDMSLLSSPSFPIGATADLSLVTFVDVRSAVIKEVTGIVNPDINIDPTSFLITDIPEFLGDKANNLDIANPQINFTVSNNSPLTLDVDGVLVAKKEGMAPVECRIGAVYGTDAITVTPNATTAFVISREPVPGNEYVNIVVPGLGELISTIPDEIVFRDVNCAARQIPVTFTLDNDFTFNANYDAVIPLAFGADMELHYNHEDDGWDSDLEKYNFKTVEISLDAVNSVPLFMKPSVTPIGISSVDVEVEGIVEAGSLASPTTTPLKIRLTSRGESLRGLDGIEIDFAATAKNPETGATVTGVNLNEAQALKLDNITIRIIGGITIDLND
ncbi:MAG: hypothetical protein K2F78_08620 [Muribaculaceae bacterium]|nr:hypothetical protein [Muribaculaceae bacterium]